MSDWFLVIQKQSDVDSNHLGMYSVLFSYLTDKRRPNAPTTLHCTPRVREV